jgi:diguanylate cyclase (GGDEF)-like protein
VPAYSGEEALALCARGDIDLLLLDVGLPGIDGYEVCRRMKSAPDMRDIPVIFITARGSDVDVTEGYSIGAVDYVPKPYNLPMVMLRVEAALRTRQIVDPWRGGGVETLADTCYTDALTGLRNRRYLMERLQEEVEKAHRYHHYVSCLALDVDDVEAVDTEFGIATTEDLLVEIALAMRKSSRSYDILARYDASLFAAVLPHAPLEDAVRYAKKIEAEVRSHAFSDPPTNAGLSFGIVSCRDGSAHGADKVFGEAMRGLFQAKSRAGTRIIARDLDALVLS